MINNLFITLSNHTIMKNRILVFICLLLAIGTSSCNLLGDGEKEFDPNLLIGKWEENGLYERYDANGQGATWDIKDDVFENEAQPFTWTLNGATLSQEHILFNGAIVPKTYTVTELNATTLNYHDNYGVSHYFTKEDSE